MTTPSLTVVIPALNEEGNVETGVSDILTALGDRFYSYEILIFDDGSTDATGAIADRLAAQNQNIKVIHHEKNRGLG